MSVRRIASLALALALLAACGPATDQPTPTLIVMGLSLPTTTPFATDTPQPSATLIAIYTNTPTIEPPPTHTPTVPSSITVAPIVTGSQTITTTPAPTAAPVKCSSGFASGNLLQNGGFEGGQHGQGPMQVPDGWSAFWRPDGWPTDYDTSNKSGYQRPDMKVIPNTPPYDNPARTLDGRQALIMTGSLKAFDAGVYQKVTATPGTTVCLSGSGEAWSNRLDDDPFTSTLDTSDDALNANLQLGIDPQGGTDAFSGTVEWSPVIHPYNLYRPMHVMTVAVSGPAITVFVRGFMLWRFNHNELYFDDISLVSSR